MKMHGPEGDYELAFEPTDDWDGVVYVAIAGLKTRWSVEAVDRDEVAVTLSGMTAGCHDLWNDEFWFVLAPWADPPTITYWGNQVVWRTDVGSEGPTSAAPP